ncbi:hypothetical protein MTYM_01324 [Methylococcales bacterium]|nr:hypothetical protein MTYM_01324 [Methylococcales bacterium]
MAKKVTTVKKTAAKSTATAKTVKATVKPAAVKKKTEKPAPGKKEPAKKTVAVKAEPVKKTAAKEKAAPKEKAASKKPIVKEVKKAVPEAKLISKPVAKPGAKKVPAAEPVRTPATSTRKPVKTRYTKDELEVFKKVIIAKRDEIIEQLSNLRDRMMDPTTGEYINENSPYSLHMAEQGTDAMEREKTFLYAQRENKFLGYLEDALKRIEMGTYGVCVECQDEPQFLCDTCPLIPKERLMAVPHSQHCLPIKQKQEKKKIF